MFDIAAEETYQDGQIICKEGSEGDWIYIVESGTVELYKEVGEEKVAIEVLQPGEIFGEIAFFAKTPRLFSARAVGSTSVEIIDRRFLDKEYNSLSASFQTILKSLALRLVKATENVQSRHCVEKILEYGKFFPSALKVVRDLLRLFQEI